MTQSPILEVKDLSVDLKLGRSSLRALREVNFTVGRGEVLGLVGESGSGKSLTGFSIMGLLEKSAHPVGGSIHFNGQDLLQLPRKSLHKLRGNRIAMIFQDPMLTLNPVLRVGTQMIETVLAHSDMSKDEARRLCCETLGLVGIPSPEQRMHAYPHQFSGGMRQRVAIAIALLMKPDLIIADEPTTALDVTVQSQILSEISGLVRDRNMALLWISHDLSLVASISDRIAVMYAGQIVEIGSVDEVVERPSHPYTRGLLSSLPSANALGRPLRQIPGAPLPLAQVDQGCSFRSRCDEAGPRCVDCQPMQQVATRHLARCWRSEVSHHAQ